MTCIVGLVHDGRVTLGGDSAGVGGLDLVVRRDRKVFRNGPAVMGFTSSFRMGQLLAYRLTVPKRHPDCELMRFMTLDFVDAVRNCLKEGGYARTVNGEEEGGVFLVGIEGRLFAIYEDFQVGEAVHGFSACGCGEAYALGALHTTAHLPPDHRVRLALETAAEFSAGVRGPFHYEQTP